jgi:hypothetical protein
MTRRYLIVPADDLSGWAVTLTWRCTDTGGEESSMRVFVDLKAMLKWIEEEEE